MPVGTPKWSYTRFYQPFTTRIEFVFSVLGIWEDSPGVTFLLRLHVQRSVQWPKPPSNIHADKEEPQLLFRQDPLEVSRLSTRGKV